MEKYDFITSLLDVVGSHVDLPEDIRAKVDAELRVRWAGAPVYIRINSPTRNDEILSATGTYEEIAKRFGVSSRTIFRIKKGK